MPRAICRFFNSNRGCRNGDACTFRHVLIKDNDHKRLSSEGGLADAAPCRNFAKAGWCPYGERCWYSHKPSIQSKVKEEHKFAGQPPVAAQEAPPPIAAMPPSLDQQRADQVKEEGNVLYRAGNYEEAVSRYTSAIEIHDAEPTYYANRAAAYISQRKFRLALADCETARTLQPSKPDVKILLRHARCQLALGTASSALGTLQTARKAQPGIGKDTDYKSLKEKADLMQELFQDLNNERRHQSWESEQYLVTRLLGMLECRYEDTVPHLIIWDMESRIATQRFQSALETLNALTQKEEKNAKYLELKARASFLSNRPAEAVTALKKALQLKEDDRILLSLLHRVQECETSKESGNQAFRRGDWTIAVGKYTAALKNVGCKPADGCGGIIRAILLSNRASAYTRMGAEKLSAALDDLAQSIRLHPKNWKAFRSRGKVWVMTEKYKKAARDFRSAIEILSEEMGATAAARRELEEELHKAQIELKGVGKPTHYDILKLERTCTTVEIKKAYRRESLIHHPDKGGDEDTFKMISEAHTTLSDPVRRRDYNERIDRMQYCEDTSDDNSDDDNLYPYDSDNPYPYDSDEELADIFFAHAFGRGYGFFDY